MQSPDISAKVDYEKDPLKIELGNIKQEAEVEDDPLKLEEILLDPIKSEPSFDSTSITYLGCQYGQFW